MREKKHTPEPWKAERYHGRGYCAWSIYHITHLASFSPSTTVSGGDDPALSEKTEDADCKANAERAVACVNAMRGIEDPAAFMENARTAADGARKQARASVRDSLRFVAEKTTSEEIRKAFNLAAAVFDDDRPLLEAMGLGRR